MEQMADLEAKVQLTGSTGESSAREILATGRRGLDFFREFGPAYAAYTGTEHDQHDLDRRYDEHGDIAFGALRQDRERFDGIEAGLTDSVIAMRNKGNAVFGAWQGAAARPAQSQFGALLTAAADLRGQFARLSAVLDVVVDAADRAVYDMAAGVRRLHTAEIGGAGPDDVAFLVDFAKRVGADDIDDDELERAAELCQVRITPAVCRSHPGTMAQVASSVDSWVAGAFVPAYEARADAFAEICAATGASLAIAWQGLADALSTVRADQFDAVLPPAQETTAQETAAQFATGAAAEPMPGAAPQPAGSGAASGAAPDHGTTQPDPLSSGQAVGAMEPAAARPAAPSAPSVAPAAAGSAAGATGAGFLGGVPFFPGGAAQGGGDHDRQSLGLPTGEGAFNDLEVPERDEVTAIGALDDERHFNEEAAEPPPEQSIDDLLNDDDLW